MIKLKDKYDVVIFGAGVAGMSVAISLTENHLSVLIVDPANGVTQKIGEGLPSRTMPLLENLRIKTNDFDKLHIPCYVRKSIWGSSELIAYDSIFDPYGHGWNLDRKLFDSLLTSAAVSNGTSIFWNAGLKQLLFNGSSVDLIIESGKSLRNISAKFIVDATGRKRNIARKLGIASVKYDSLFSFHYLINDNHERNEGDHFSCQSFTESCEQGWWYTSVLPGNNRIFSFYTNPGSAYFHLAKTPDGFKTVLNKTVYIKQFLTYPNKLPSSLPVGKYANSEQLTTIAGKQWLATGDAAAAFDPLSSQGIYTALQMGIRAAEAIYGLLINKSDHLTDEYIHDYKSLFNTYLSERNDYYLMEQRWSGNAFWQMNHSEMSLIKNF